MEQEELCVEVIKRAPSFLESGQWTDCKFVVGAEPHQVVVGGNKLVMAMASPVFEAMLYGSLAETRDHISIVDVEPEIFRAMLRYIHTSNVKPSSCGAAIKLYYTATKYMLHQLKKECSNYLQNNVNVANVCQVYEHSLLFEDDLLAQKCINIFTENTKELLQDSSFKNAALSTVEKIFSQNELNIDSELDLINAAALYASAQDVSVINVENNVEALIETQNSTDGPEQATPGSSHQINDTVDQQEIRSVVKHIRFRTLTPEQYDDCEARCSLLTSSEDDAVFLNIVSNKLFAPMPSGLSTSRITRDKVGKARSEATFRYTLRNFNILEDDEYSRVFYVRNLPWRVVVTLADREGIKYLALGVECNAENESTSWSCYAMIGYTLIPHKPGAEIYRRSDHYCFTNEDTEWCVHILPWNTVLDPIRGYIQDDTIIFDVHIVAFEPQGVIVEGHQEQENMINDHRVRRQFL